TCKWICYARLDGSFASELYIVPSTGPTAADPPRNVTRYATYNGGVSWSPNHKLAFISQRRRNHFGVCVLSLQKLAVPGAPATGNIDWKDIYLRVTQTTSMSAGECSISANGTGVAFRAREHVDDLR